LIRAHYCSTLARACRGAAAGRAQLASEKGRFCGFDVLACEALALLIDFLFSSRRCMWSDGIDKTGGTVSARDKTGRASARASEAEPRTNTEITTHVFTRS
jgi:hypothetical protein